jgi:predicted alpha/beta-fold hydrolase
MPLVSRSAYRPMPPFRSAHVQTIYPALCRTPIGIRYRRERIGVPDGDFIDLDHAPAKGGAERVAVVLHGMEGHSRRPYMQGMARALNRRGWDVAAYNFRGCSGAPNRRLRSYHSGETDDLQTVLGHALDRGRYRAAALVGFSLGGNMVLKYLGEDRPDRPAALKSAAAVSAPCDLAGCARRMAAPENRIYLRRFLREFHAKIRAKMERFPGEIDDRGYSEIRDFETFDDRYTAPLHGFRDAADYYARASGGRFLSGIGIPALLLSAWDDPFLPPSCYPESAARDHPFLYLETPARGGHVGFVRRNGDGEYWHEQRIAGFLDGDREGHMEPGLGG